MQSFKGLNIPADILGVLEEEGFENPSPVQLSVIPSALRGESVMAQSPTGSGKTLSYIVPILSRIDPSLPRLQALVVVPIRELARQVVFFFEPFLKKMEGIRLQEYTGNTDREEEAAWLSKYQPQIAVGTPGRLLDLINEGLLKLKDVKTVVLDEADMLLDMGFFEEAGAILEAAGPTQVLVFSATLKEHLKSALAKYVRADLRYEGGKEKTAGEVRHHLVDVRHQDRNVAAVRLLKAKRPYLALVFVNKKEEAGPLYTKIKEAGFSAVSYTGDLSERERRRTMRLIREGEYQVVVGSDLLSRGIDLPDVDFVLSLDLPSDSDFYYHRAGRTGRFGKDGDSYVFYDLGEEEKAKVLLEAGVPFDFFTLKGENLVSDPKGLTGKKRRFKPEVDSDQGRELSIVKARMNSKEVKPGYKKKKKLALEKVRAKYRRKAIKAAVRRNAYGKKSGGK